MWVILDEAHRTMNADMAVARCLSELVVKVVYLLSVFLRLYVPFLLDALNLASSAKRKFESLWFSDRSVGNN